MKLQQMMQRWLVTNGEQQQHSFNGHFWDSSGKPVQNATILEFVGARMMEVMVTAGVIRREKLPSRRHHQHANMQFFQAGWPSCRPTIIIGALKGESITFHGTTPSSHGSIILILITKGFWLRYFSHCQFNDAFFLNWYNPVCFTNQHVAAK